ncbi:hypothetical protein Tco_0465901 [Tanacetum coccineum]
MKTLCGKSLLSRGDNKHRCLEKTIGYDSWKNAECQHRVAKDLWEKIKLLMHVNVINKTRTVEDKLPMCWKQQIIQPGASGSNSGKQRTVISQASVSFNRGRNSLFADPDFLTIQISQTVITHNDAYQPMIWLSRYDVFLTVIDETVQNYKSSAQQDVMIISMFEQLTTQVMHCTNVNLEYKSANQALITELDRNKEEVKDLKEMPNVEITVFFGSNDRKTEILIDEIALEKKYKQLDKLHFQKEVNLRKLLSMKEPMPPDITEGTWGVTKLVAENEHLKQTYKQLYDSIKPKRVQSKEQCDALIKQVNIKSGEISDLNAKLQEQGLVIAALKNELRKLKGKAVDKEAIETHSVDPNVLKDNMEPITPKLLNKRTAHSSYIKHTQEEALVLRDIVEHVKANYPHDSLLESAFRYTKVIQDLLSHISRSCPSINNFGHQLVEEYDLATVLADLRLQHIGMIGFPQTPSS